MELDNLDVSKTFYPVLVIIFGWYIVANVVRLAGEWAGDPMNYVYTVVWTLVPVSIAYAISKDFRLRLRTGKLFAAGAVLVAVFSAEAVLYFLTIPIGEIMLTGIWDHTFFPVGFGMIMMCDLDELDKRFWQLMLPFALFSIVPNFNVVGNVLFEVDVIPPAPGFFDFFGPDVTTWAELRFDEHFAKHFVIYLFEQLTFFTLFPALIVSQWLKKRSGRSGNKRAEATSLKN